MFDKSFAAFLTRERRNLLADVNERNLCARWSIYLQEAASGALLDGYYADADYNRKQGGRVKTILNSQHEIITIIADLILHSRGEIVARDNLIAIEMKKATRPEAAKEEDRRRLQAMTKKSFNEDIWSADGRTAPEHVCGYELGCFVELDVRLQVFKLEFFLGGRLVEECEGKF